MGKSKIFNPDCLWIFLVLLIFSFVVFDYSRSIDKPLKQLEGRVFGKTDTAIFVFSNHLKNNKGVIKPVSAKVSVNAKNGDVVCFIYGANNLKFVKLGNCRQHKKYEN